MKTTLKMITTLFILTGTLFGLDSKELAVTIDLSGKQRMLTQEMIKEAFLIKSNIDKKSNIEKLKHSSQLFDRTLNGLIAGDKELKLVAIKDKKIQEQLKKISTIWGGFYLDIKDILSGTDNEKNYYDITSKSAELLKEVNHAVELYAKEDKKSNFLLANDMNFAGKQRMLLQKMAKSLLIANNKIDVDKNKREFIESQQLFTKILKGLSAGDKELNLRGTSLPAITKQLKFIQELWSSKQSDFKLALNGQNTKDVINDLDNLLIESDKLVKLYTASLYRQKQRDEFASLIRIHATLEKMDSKTKLLLKELAKAETN
ncbi:MAG: hypothetical protein GXO60_09295 [Epsilonproteobacteria bacterium]|nr:hypothetical protein [Campylobacterota bacterium]